MKTYVMVSKIASRNAGMVEVGAGLRDRTANVRAWLEEIKVKCPEVKFKAHYALLGHWDFMDIYEAPDEETVAKVSMITRTYGAREIESWCAIPSDRLQKLAEDLGLFDTTDKIEP
jgi:uncharacterized protein with GYD domain